jgi:5'-3' exonuclease
MSKKHLSKKLKQGSQGFDFAIIDCHALAYAAMYTTGSFSFNGEETGVVFGFLKKLLVLAETLGTNKFFFCWDAHPTCRIKQYPEYKQQRKDNRKRMDLTQKKHYDSMIRQRETLRLKVLPEIGFMRNYMVDGFESDDIIAAIVNQYHKSHKICIVSSDNDFFQLLDKCSMYRIKHRKLYRREDFEREYGIRPDQWADAKAIGGCSGDNVKGIKGVADPKSTSSGALKYIRGEMTKGKVFDKIESSKDEIAKARELVVLPHSTFGRRFITRRDKVDRQKILKLFFRLGFKSFIESDALDRWIETFCEEEKNVLSN